MKTQTVRCSTSTVLTFRVCFSDINCRLYVCVLHSDTNQNKRKQHAPLNDVHRDAVSVTSTAVLRFSASHQLPSVCFVLLDLVEIKHMHKNANNKAARWLSWYGVGLASADRLPVVVRIPAGPLGSLKCDPPKGNGRRQKKKHKNANKVDPCKFENNVQTCDHSQTYIYKSRKHLQHSYPPLKLRAVRRQDLPHKKKKKNLLSLFEVHATASSVIMLRDVQLSQLLAFPRRVPWCMNQS